MNLAHNCEMNHQYFWSVSVNFISVSKIKSICSSKLAYRWPQSWLIWTNGPVLIWWGLPWGLRSYLEGLDVPIRAAQCWWMPTTAEGTLGVGCISQHCSPALLSPVGSPCNTFFFLLPRVLLGALLTHCGSFRMHPPSPTFPSSLPPPPPSLQSKALPTSQPSSTVKPCQLHSWYYHRLSSAKNETETRSLVDLNIVLKCLR